ncbi:MAG: protein phosphatase 2C domain-containing protein [Bacteroidetes bacterium]|nr:protein phosphatase 2C domain-containing protein [Bacteroidota bacterium]
MLKKSGEHLIILNFQLKNDSAEKPFNKKEIKLIVNPDPKSLWIAKDSDSSDKYWKADCASVHAIVGTKQLVIASKRGRSHAQEGIFRDDDFGYSYFEETGWGIIAVADGAGSAKYSRKGSLIACNEVISYFENLDKERLQELELSIQNNIKDTTEENQKILSSYFIEHLGKAAFGAQVKIKDEALANNATIKDYSTTLIFHFN